MRAVAALGILAALGACQVPHGIPPVGGGASVPRAAPAARYAGDGVIEVTAVDPQAISDVEVIGPRGTMPSALSVHREDAAGQAPPAGGPPHPMSMGSQLLGLLPLIGIGIGYATYSGGVGTAGGLWFSPPPQAFSPGYYTGSSVVSAAPPPSGLYRSTARVTLDDPDAYRRGWRQATIRVRLGDPRTGPTQDLPAPEPAPQ